MNQNEKESPKILGEEEYEKAIYLVNSGHLKESLPLFHKSSNLNYPPSFLWLYSLVVDENERQNWRLKASPNFTWYQSKAQDRKPDSLYNLGYCFEYEIGTKSNYKKAIEIYTKAAEQGFAIAQHRLGDYYYYGRGFPKDINIAIKLYTKAAEQGFVKAKRIYFPSGNVDMQALTDFLKVGGIQLLTLNENNIGEIGAQAIADALKINNTLTELSLFSNSIGNEGVKAIVGVFKTNNTLTSLSLYGNEIGDEGAQVIADVLKVNKFTVKNNKIEDEGLNAIAEMLKVNNSLQELYMRENKFTDISKLGDALKYNRSLTKLFIEENKSNVKELEKALQFNICLLEIVGQYPFQSRTINGLLQRNNKIQTTLSERIFKCKTSHLSLLDYKILERVNVAVIFKNVWNLHQTQQTVKTYEEYLIEYWELISLNTFSEYFLFILGVCKLNQIAPSRSHLLGIPKEILAHIGSFLNPRDFLIDLKETHKILKTEKKQKTKKQATNKREKTVEENQNDQTSRKKRKK